MLPDLSANFPPYTDFDPLVPVYCVTPKTSRCIHRFFDTSPFSPSGRYIAVTRLPYEDRLPTPGDAAEIVVVDLQTGEERIVAATRGWDTQLGAQVQWGADDTQLLFNDLDTQTWLPFLVLLDPLSGNERKIAGTVYMASPGGRYAASPCLLRTAVTQAGYGVVVPPEKIPRNEAAADDDGVWVTDIETGRTRLIASHRDIFEKALPAFEKSRYAGGDFWGAHAKCNAQGDRIMFVFRWLSRDGKRRLNNVITMKADGSDIRVAIPDSEWKKGGHHPNWCPDGQTVMMNLKLDGEHMRFVSAKYDGSGLKSLTDAVPGSGHPTLHPNGLQIVTDAYPHEPVAFDDGTVPIRLVDIGRGSEQCLVRVASVPDYKGPKSELRVDPHPAWDYTFTRIALNTYTGGTRRVFVANLSAVLRPRQSEK